VANTAVAAVWIFHGIYSKLLNGIPRHQRIVGRILGERLARPATKLVGALEFLLGIWVFSGWQPIACATVQTLAIVAMNTLEIAIARELLISALGMVILNAALLAVAWYCALRIAANA